MHPYVHCSFTDSGQDMEITKVSFARGLDKEDVIHIAYFLGRGVCSGPLPILIGLFVCLVVVVEVLYIFWILTLCQSWFL